jgi:O-acetyl-ADP-ribose deacetylase (regulator of RNase III)
MSLDEFRLGFDLQARYVLHTVGPIYDDEEAELCEEELEGCYRTTLELAKEHGLKTIALCGVSTGVYGFPLRDATEIALRTTRMFLQENPQQVTWPSSDQLVRKT